MVLSVLESVIVINTLWTDDQQRGQVTLPLSAPLDLGYEQVSASVVRATYAPPAGWGEHGPGFYDRQYRFAGQRTWSATDRIAYDDADALHLDIVRPIGQADGVRWRFRVRAVDAATPFNASAYAEIQFAPYPVFHGLRVAWGASGAFHPVRVAATATSAFHGVRVMA